MAKRWMVPELIKRSLVEGEREVRSPSKIARAREREG